MALRSNRPVAIGVAGFGDLLRICLTTAGAGESFTSDRGAGCLSNDRSLIPGVSFRTRCLTYGAGHTVVCTVKRSSGPPCVVPCRNGLEKDLVTVIAGDLLTAGFRAGCILNRFHSSIDMGTGRFIFLTLSCKGRHCHSNGQKKGQNNRSDFFHGSYSSNYILYIL